MNLAIRSDMPAGATDLDLIEQAQFHCLRARELEDAGDYESARDALSPLWSGVGERPSLEGLDSSTASEVLLRAGVLTGWLGSTNQIENAQETAKNLITDSIGGFEPLRETEKIAEAYSELALCYRREGALDEARITLREALRLLGDAESDTKALVLLRSAIVEKSATRTHEALRVLTEAAPLFATSNNHSLKGRFHGERAQLLRSLGTDESRDDYVDRALVESEAARFHFEQANHTQYCARLENNLAFLFFTIGKFDEAHEHVDRSRRLFLNLKDKGGAAQADETRARVLLAQGRNSEAEKTARAAVQVLERGGEYSFLAEALISHGQALARLDRQPREARQKLDRAAEVAEQAGDTERAGQALLSLIEELGACLTPDELRITYLRADEMLERSQRPDILARLRRCARRVCEARYHQVEKFSAPEFIHAAEGTKALLRDARAVARADGGAVLLTGETGTGKEILARNIHAWSGRGGKFVPVNCAALCETLLESQLFGHRKGSFTNAIEDYDGAARIADGGTLFLDEIAELSLVSQGKLLRLIEHGEIHTLGSPMPERIDVRIIAATNGNLKQLVAAGKFRQDLFYRLETFHLVIPPLRERPDDIPELAAHFLSEATQKHHKRLTFTPEALEATRRLPLCGNTRELQSLIERTLLTAADGAVITGKMLEVIAMRYVHKGPLTDPWAGFSLKNEVHHVEQRFIELALRDSDGMVSRAARLLGFKHHESLNSLLNNRFQYLLDARAPVTPRRRSIIRERAA